MATVNSDLVQMLIRSLRKLGQHGYPDEASRLAAQAWSALRHSDPDEAERINGTMHYLARLPDPEFASRLHDLGHTTQGGQHDGRTDS